jgi:hypothetical protein
MMSDAGRSDAIENVGAVRESPTMPAMTDGVRRGDSIENVGAVREPPAMPAMCSMLAM